MGIRVVLAAAPGIARQAYLEELLRLGAEVEVLDSPKDVLMAVVTHDCQGILFDTPTLIRDKSFDRRALGALESVFPVIRLRYDHQDGRIDGICDQQIFDQGDVLNCFIQAECGQFHPRTLRGVERRDLSLPVFLCDAAHQAPEAGEKTATINLSMRGCFVFSVAARPQDAQLWLIFADFEDQTPVPVRVSWNCPWGARREVPGVGLEFLSLTLSQTNQLESLGLRPERAALAPDAQAV